MTQGDSTRTSSGTGAASEMIDKLMRLAALKLEADERRMLKDNLDRIVALIDAMRSADTDGVEPLDHPLDGVQPLRPVPGSGTCRARRALSRPTGGRRRVTSRLAPWKTSQPSTQSAARWLTRP